MLAASRQSELNRFGLMLHIAGLVVLCIVGVVFYFAVHVPIRSARADIKDRVAQNQERLAAAANTRTQYESLNDRLHESEELAELVRRRIPQQPQASQFLGAITDMAQLRGMTIGDFAVGQEFERETHHELSIQFKTSGDYASICRFLDQLLTMQRVVGIENLTVDGDLDGAHEVHLSLLLPFGIKSAPAPTEAADG